VFLNGVASAVGRRAGWGYRYVVAAFLVLLLVALAATIWLAGPALVGQIQQVSSRIPTALEQVRRLAERLPLLESVARSVPPAASIVTAAAGFARIGTKAVVGIGVALVIGLYGALDPGAYERSFLQLVPPDRRGRARDVLESAARTLMRWMVGRVAV